MVTIIKTEFLKLKRYFIVWIGVALMLLTVLLTLFTTMADDVMFSISFGTGRQKLCNNDFSNVYHAD